MSDNITERELLYDPMFEKKPPTDWEDSEKGGIFGKAAVKKAFFILFLLVAIGLSLLFSFQALGKEKYTYEEKDFGTQFSEFNGTEKDKVLNIVYAIGEDGKADTSRPVHGVREYAVCCNEYIEFVFIGKDVTNLDYNCFYYCTNLKAVIIDKDNKSFASVDGVVYTKDMKEIVIHPIKNNEYRAALALGIKAPATQDDCEKFFADFEERFGNDTENRTEKTINLIAKYGSEYTIPKTVTKIAPFCFNYCDGLTHITIPDGVKEIGQMAFFKCTSLESIYLPDGLETIGADGVSYCEKLNYIYVPSSVKTIGHHAFYGCLGCDKIYLGAIEDAAPETGEGWLPKQSERSVKNVEVLYGQERRVN